MFIQVQNANSGTIRRESQGDGSSNAATATGYKGDFAVQSETLRMCVLIYQRDVSFPGDEVFLPVSSASNLAVCNPNHVVQDGFAHLVFPNFQNCSAFPPNVASCTSVRCWLR